MKLFGAVKNEVEWTYDAFTADFHCVTRWSRLDNAWKGVAVSEVMKHVERGPEGVCCHVETDEGPPSFSFGARTTRTHTASPASS